MGQYLFSESLLPKSHGYIEPNDQTLAGKILRSNSIDSNFSDDENCHSSAFHRIGQKDSSSIRSDGFTSDMPVDLGYGSWPSRASGKTFKSFKLLNDGGIPLNILIVGLKFTITKLLAVFSNTMYPNN